MAPKKRSADGEADATDRATKVARTGKGKATQEKNKNGTKKTPAKAAMSSAEFTAKALPLHVNLTHTPPSIMKEDDVDADATEEEKTPLAVATTATQINDVGFIGNLTLVPSSFSTGSYGWKGSKRITVELQGGNVDEQGVREKVQVMLSINATVLGSKPVKSQTEKNGRGGEEEAEEDGQLDDDADVEVKEGEDRDEA